MKIGLIGWYGHGNAGDERILYSLRRFFEGHKFFITSSFGDAAKHIEQLNACDYVLLGGGGLILRGLNTYTELIERIKPALGGVGLGVEAYHEDNASFIDALKDKAEFILVRDEQSRELLDNHFKVIVSSDLTFLYPFDVVEPVESDTCGVNLRDWYFWRCEHGDEYYKKMIRLSKLKGDLEKDYPHPKWEPAKAFDIIRKRFSNLVAAPLYFESNSKSDHALLRTLFDKKVDDPVGLPEIYRSCRYFVGMRLHSLIFACQMGVPFVSLSYQPKNERFCKALGLEKLSVDLFNIGELDAAITILKDSYPQLRERLLDWRERAHADIHSAMSNIRKLMLGSSAGFGTDLKKQPAADPGKTCFLAPIPRVSVVLPTYNHLKFLPKAVESVLKQTYTDFELIIVNDGSTDGTREYLDGLEDKRIRVIHQENKHLPEALNAGFRAARGDLLTWISADNYCAPIYLEAFVAALNAYPDAGFAYSAYMVIDGDGKVVGRRRDHDFSYHNLLTHNAGTASFMYRRICQEKVGLYDTKLEGAEDWDMWLRIVERFQTIYVPEILYYYRQHNDSMTARFSEKVLQASRQTVQKAIEHRNNRLDINDLYPTIKRCKYPKTAKFYAYFDFGTALLEWGFAPTELACQMLRNALSLSLDSIEAVANLAVAYGLSEQWQKILPLLRQMTEKAQNPKVLGVCRSIIEAYQASKPDMLSKKLLFKPNKGSIELFQLERKNKRVFSFVKTDQNERVKIPSVSVIVPCYNTAKYLGEAIESVLAQTYTDFEAIVVDDGSTDNTREVVRSFDDKRIRYVYQENKGLAAARNTGIRHSQGQYLTFLDADDYFLPNKLTDQVAFLENHPEIGLVAGGYLRVDEQGKLIYENKINSPEIVSAEKILVVNVFAVHATLIRRLWFGRVGTFDESLPAAEDWDLYCRLAISGCKMYRTTDVVCACRFSPRSMSTNAKQQTDAMLRVVEKSFSDANLTSDLAGLEAKAKGYTHLKGAIRHFGAGLMDGGRRHLALALRHDPNLKDNNYNKVIELLIFFATCHVQFDSPLEFVKLVFDNLPQEMRDMQKSKERTLQKLMTRHTSVVPSKVASDTPGDVISVDKKKIYEGLNKCYFSEQCHEKETIEHLPEILNGVKTFVDVGASLGQYTFYANKHIQAGKIFAIEADPIRFEQLKRNCSMWESYSANKLVPLFAAASDKSKQETFYVTNSCKSGGLFKHNISGESVNWQQIVVDSITLDELFEDSKPDLVKIDVEGAELRVLKGAKRLLKEGRTKFLVELHSWANPNETLKFMEQFGYSRSNFHGRQLFVNEKITSTRALSQVSHGKIQPAFPDCMVRGAFLPPALSFEVCNRCNAACIMCDGSDNHQKAAKKEAARWLTADELSRKLTGVEHIKSATLSGGYCEPFLNKDIIEIISILKNKHASVKIISNGTLINETMAEKIIRAQLDSLHISLHGATQETAESIMRKARFQQIISNIRELTRLKTAHSSRLPSVSIIFVAMRRNIHELNQLVCLAAKLGVRSVIVKSLMERQNLSELRGESLVRHHELLIRQYQRAEITARKHGVHLSSNAPYSTIITNGSYKSHPEDKQIMRNAASEGKTRYCLFPFESPFIGISGAVALCCSQTGRSVCMGNSSITGFASVWDNNPYIKLRTSLLTGQELPSCCANCDRAPAVDPIVMQMEIALRQAQTGIKESQKFVRENKHCYPEYCNEVKSIGGVPQKYIDQSKSDSVIQSNILAKFANKYAGRRVFIIGNGPSLKRMDLTKLEDQITFGVNSIFYHFDKMGFKPTFYVVEDKLVAEDRAEEIKALTGMVKIFGTELEYCLKDSPDTIWANVIYDFSNYPGFPNFSKDASKCLWVGGTVSYLCMQLAYYMGFSEVYLVGFDHNYTIPADARVEGTVITSASADPNHFHPDYFGKGKRWHDPRLDRMEKAYKRAKEVFEKDGRKIYNATTGGKLEIFPRIDYESLFITESNDGRNKPRISVVVCTHRNPVLLSKTLDSLTRQNLNNELYEVIVVDNNSQDNTRDIVGCYPSVRYVFEQKLGLSYARNTGIEKAQGDIIAFIDDDAEASPGWLEALLSIYDNAADAWAVGGRVLPIWDAERPQWLTEDYYRALSLIEWGENTRALQWPERIIGTNCSFKREVFSATGKFRPELGRIGSIMLSFEDTEIQQRIHQTGHSVYYSPDATVYHHVPAVRMTEQYFCNRSLGNTVSQILMILSESEDSSEVCRVTDKLRNIMDDTTGKASEPVEEQFLEQVYSNFVKASQDIPVEMKVKFCSLAAKYYLVLKKYDEAENKCLQGLALPNIPKSQRCRLLIRLAEVYVKQDKQQQSFKKLYEALSIGEIESEEAYQFLKSLGENFGKPEQFEQIEKTLDDILSSPEVSERNKVAVVRYFTSIYVAREMYTEAEQMYSKMLAPGNLELASKDKLFLGLGELYANQGRYTEAREVLNSAMEIEMAMESKDKRHKPNPTMVSCSVVETGGIGKETAITPTQMTAAGKCRFSHLVLDYTRLCNSRCTYCGIWKMKDAPELSLDAIERTFSSLSDFGLSTCYLTGGEPYISDKVVEIARLLHKYLPGCRIAGATNGIQPLHIIRRIRRILELGVPVVVHLSLNGRQATHDATRGGKGYWKKAVYLLETLKSCQVPVEASMSLMPQTIADLPYMQEFCAERDIRLMYSWVRQCVRYGEVDRYYSTWPEELKPKLRQIEYLPDEFDCVGLSKRLVITPDGSVYPCEVYHPEILLGNVNEKPFGEMLNSARAASVMRMIAEKGCYWCQGAGENDGSPKWMLMDCYRRHSPQAAYLAENHPQAVHMPPEQSKQVIESVLGHKRFHQIPAFDKQNKHHVIKDDNGKKQIRISAVVCTRRNPDLLAKTLDSLIRQNLNRDQYEIIVVDNNSQDGTADVVGGYPSVRYVFEEKLGLSYARNTGVKQAQAEIIAFIDDDAEASPGWLEALLNVYDKIPEALAVGGKVLPIWDAEKPAWLTEKDYRALSLVEWGQEPRHLRWPQRIIGTNCSFRRQVFTDIGYFDTSLGRIGPAMLGNEDTEIQQRIHASGHLVYYAPDALVFHHVPAWRMTQQYIQLRAEGTRVSETVMSLRSQGRHEQAQQITDEIREKIMLQENTQSRQAKCSYPEIHTHQLTACRRADSLYETIRANSKRLLMRYKNKYRGQRCVIVGNGPSLNKTDLSLLKNEYTFGLNKIYLLFDRTDWRPTFYAAVNPFVIQQSARQILDDIAGLKFLDFVSFKYLPYRDDIIYLLSLNAKGFSTDPSEGIFQSHTVTYVAMQLAHYLGFDEVFLIGVDHFYSAAAAGKPNQVITQYGEDNDHFDPGYFGKGCEWHLPDLKGSEEGYETAKVMYEKAGKKIYDATIGGHLSVFEKVDFYQVFGSNKNSYLPVTVQQELTTQRLRQPPAENKSLFHALTARATRRSSAEYCEK